MCNYGNVEPIRGIENLNGEKMNIANMLKGVAENKIGEMGNGIT
jgi:hypothetical protein